MADVTVTAANVQASDNAILGRGTAGETITQGMPVYQKASDLRWYKAVRTSQEAANATGVSLTASSAGQPIVFAVSDPEFTPGFTATAGTVFCVSDTAGRICPSTDVSGGWMSAIAAANGDETTVALSCGPMNVQTDF